jgi:alcohol dehydrogenase
MSGATEAVELCISLLGVGGRAVLVGAVFHTPAARFMPEMVVRGLLTICGVHNYLPRDLAAALDFLESEHQRYPFAELVTKTFPLAEAEEAFRYAEKHRPIRVAVMP